MELRVLRYFLAIAREGSITNAAAFFHVTQPTLSRQIKDLESELGKRLFIRGSHSMTLTAEGMLLRKRAAGTRRMSQKGLTRVFWISEYSSSLRIYQSTTISESQLRTPGESS